MGRGIITGKRASEYEKKMRARKNSRLFDRFIQDNVKGKSLKIADFCCGPANVIEIVLPKCEESVGVDASIDMISIAKKKFKKDKRVRLMCRAVTNTHLLPHHFDYVIIRMGLHHIKEKDKALQEAHRILKPDGRLIVIDKFYLDIFKHYKWEAAQVFKGNTELFSHSVKSEKNTEKLLSKDFKIIKKEYAPIYKDHSGRAFMFVLKKRVD